MTHADRAYSAPQELDDLRQEFKPERLARECTVDGVTYDAQDIPDGKGSDLCDGCAGDGKELCADLGSCASLREQIIWIARA